MREGFLRSALLQPDRSTPPLVDVKDGSFADLPFESSSADIIVGAQCWHWAHPDYGQAIAEFARVLKPGGTLAFIWNLEDRDTDWVAKVRDTYEAYEKGTPQYRLGWWKETFKTAEYKVIRPSPHMHLLKVLMSWPACSKTSQKQSSMTTSSSTPRPSKAW